MMIKSFYGVKFEQSEDAIKYYERQLKKAIATLGDKYRLANPLRRGDIKNGN